MTTSLYKKGLVLAVICLFIGAGVLPITGAIKNFEKINIVANPTSMDTITVDDEGDGDYTCIQDAIDNASDGNTIIVYSGTYYEIIEVNISINLIGISNELGYGNDSGKPVLDAINNTDDAVNIITLNEDNCIIDGFELINSEDGYTNNIGVVVSSSNNNVIKNMSIPDWFTFGIMVEFSDNNTIINNNLENSICIWGSNNNDISNNIIFNESIHGINLMVSSNNKIYKNEISNCVQGILLNVICSNNNISNNLITSSAICAIKISNSSSNMIYQNLLMFNAVTGIAITSGIFGEPCENNEIYQNMISSGTIGIYLKNTNNNLITKNDISLAGVGISMVSSPLNTVSQNNIRGVLNAQLVNSLQNKWKNNYWSSHPSTYPKLIIGRYYMLYPIHLLAIYYPNFDWRPSLSPHPPYTIL